MKDIKVIDQIAGEGPAAEKGSVDTCNARCLLRRDDEVTRDGEIIARMRDRISTRIVGGIAFIDHATELGKRRPIAGVGRLLYGMRRNDCREVLAAPHMVFGVAGVPGRVPANAVFRLQLWVQDVRTT